MFAQPLSLNLRSTRLSPSTTFAHANVIFMGPRPTETVTHSLLLWLVRSFFIFQLYSTCFHTPSARIIWVAPAAMYRNSVTQSDTHCIAYACLPLVNGSAPKSTLCTTYSSCTPNYCFRAEVLLVKPPKPIQSCSCSFVFFVRPTPACLTIHHDVVKADSSHVSHSRWPFCMYLYQLLLSSLVKVVNALHRFDAQLP